MNVVTDRKEIKIGARFKGIVDGTIFTIKKIFINPRNNKEYLILRVRGSVDKGIACNSTSSASSHDCKVLLQYFQHLLLVPLDF